MGPLTAFLLSMPMLGPAPPAGFKATPEDWQRLKNCAHMLEITGDVEPWACDGKNLRLNSSWNDSYSYRSEWQWCRNTWSEVNDCPHLCETDDLPPYEYCAAWSYYQNLRIEYLEKRRN
jgi:hypothetical protein